MIGVVQQHLCAPWLCFLESLQSLVQHRRPLSNLRLKSFWNLLNSTSVVVCNHLKTLRRLRQHSDLVIAGWSGHDECPVTGCSSLPTTLYILSPHLSSLSHFQSNKRASCASLLRRGFSCVSTTREVILINPRMPLFCLPHPFPCQQV